MRRQWLKGLLGVVMLGALASAGPAAEMKKALARLQTKYMDQWDARSAA